MASTSVAADGPYLYGRYADDTMLKTALLVVEQSSVKCSSRDYNQKVFENATVARILDGRLQFYMDLWDMSGQHYNRSTAIFPQPCTAVLLVYAPQFPASLHIMPHFAQRARRSTGTGTWGSSMKPPDKPFHHFSCMLALQVANCSWWA